jgi:rubredoxin
VALRVAAATSKGNLSVTAAVLNSSAPAPLPAGEMGYFCASSGAASVNGTGTPVASARCVSMPLGTAGALTRAACEAQCFSSSGEEGQSLPQGRRNHPRTPPTTTTNNTITTTLPVAPAPAPAPAPVFFCDRCSHVYDPERDGGGAAFADLPESWSCPLCGAPKAAYARQLAADGSTERWVH